MYVVSSVCIPLMISTSCIIGGGFMKCIPIICNTTRNLCEILQVIIEQSYPWRCNFSDTIIPNLEEGTFRKHKLCFHDLLLWFLEWKQQQPNLRSKISGSPDLQISRISLTPQCFIADCMEGEAICMTPDIRWSPFQDVEMRPPVWLWIWSWCWRRELQWVPRYCPVWRKSGASVAQILPRLQSRLLPAPGLQVWCWFGFGRVKHLRLSGISGSEGVKIWEKKEM